MISDYCDFTMSSTFSATGQLLDVKRASDRKLARLGRRSRLAGFAFGQTDGHVLRRRQRCLCSRDVALPHQYLRLARVGQGKTRVRCDGPVIRLGCAGEKR